MKTLKNLSFLAVFVFASFRPFAQIDYQDLSFNQALEQAKATNQLIFIQLFTDCTECNEVAETGLSNQNLKKIFDTFICLRYNKGSEDYQLIENRYRVQPIYPTSLILDENGYFLTVMYDSSTSESSKYLSLAAEALAIRDNPPLKDFVDKYTSGDYDATFLKKYISTLNKYRFETDDLLDEYVGKCTIDSLYSTETFLFIMDCAPIIDSRPYKLVRFDFGKYDSVFMAKPLEERRKINNLTIGKSRKLAYSNRDENYMHNVAYFVSGTYKNEYTKGGKAQLNNMLDFYHAMKDSAKYIREAKSYYNMYLQRLNVDSLSVEERNRFMRTDDGRIIKGGNLLETGNQINKMAWTIYEFTDDPEYLGMIQKWTERILVYENPAYHDTYAHILYKLGAVQKGIEWQEKAVEIAEKLHYPTNNLQRELEKMKNGEL